MCLIIFVCVPKGVVSEGVFFQTLDKVKRFSLPKKSYINSKKTTRFLFTPATLIVSYIYLYSVSGVNKRIPKSVRILCFFNMLTLCGF